MFVALSLIGLAIGALILRDANRLAQHVQVAEALMASGVQEVDAMQRSGCNFWDTPMHRRIGKRYPALKRVE